jgi:hypothetical protein
MASSTSKDKGKHPVSVDDDFDIDELDGADSNTVVLSSWVIPRTARTRLQMYSMILPRNPPRNLHLNMRQPPR